MSSKIVALERAAALVPDGAVLAVSSSSGLNTPDAFLAALGARFRAEGRPRGLTVLMPISAGDMYGIKGIDHLAQPGMLARVIGGSYPSGPSSFEPPRIRAMIANDEVAAWNLPSGVLFDMLRDVAAKRAGVLTKVGLGTFVDPRLEGGRMNASARPDIVRVVEFGGEEWLHVPNIVPNVGILRGTTADEDGNVSMEHEGAVLGAVDVALAVRNSGGVVIAQVKRTHGARLDSAAARDRAVDAGRFRRRRPAAEAGHARSPTIPRCRAKCGARKARSRRCPSAPTR